MKTKLENQRKMLFMLPVLVVPFLSLAFYAMGGGAAKESALVDSLKKINTELPVATFKKETPLDRLSIYQLKEKLQEDSLQSDLAPAVSALTTRHENSTERQINERIARLQNEIQQPQVKQSLHQSLITPTENADIKEATFRLEKLMAAISDKNEGDPEIHQLNNMLDKIIRIQNPDALLPDHSKDTLIQDHQFLAIRAEVPRKQKVANGASIELSLIDSLNLKGYTVPAGHKIFGTCRIANQRLLLDIKTIRIDAAILPVDLTVYGMDGMPGIFVPEANLSELGNKSAGRVLSGTSFYGMDTGIAGQLTGAGIDATKEVLGRKLRKIKVRLEQGQSVLLRNNQNQRTARIN